MDGKCKFDIAWGGLCGDPADETGMCEKHRGMKCRSCGAQATRECSYTGQFVCGAPLCDNCTHTDGDFSKGLGWGFVGHNHVPKARKGAA